jgi:hypothetical protein
MSWLQKLISSINHAGSVTWLPWQAEVQAASSFLVANDFEQEVACARRLSDFNGVCSNLASISFNFSSVSTRRF